MGAVPTYDGIADPLFVLATPRSFSSVVCAMLGQHPQMYSLPETHLFGHETIEAWWTSSSEETFQMSHGLLRAVSELFFGEQTEPNVMLAEAWLRRRMSNTSGMVFEDLSRAVAPSILIDKSPNVVYSVESMYRIRRFFPQARFIHLVRHPRGYCKSVVKYMHTLSRPGYQRPGMTAGEAPGWISDLAHSTDPSWSLDPEVLDPQSGWHALNMNIARFLASVPSDQWQLVRGEELLERPDRELIPILEWLDVRADDAAIEEMKHPERSPYANFGPKGARLGNDILFLEQPALRAARAQHQTLDGPLEWRPECDGFLPEVDALARDLGYG
jgi:hypothetical protein